MNFQQKHKLEKMLNSVVNVLFVHSYDVQSRRIEGQFGGEIIKKGFSEIYIYIQYNQSFIFDEVLKDIVRQCYSACKKISAGMALKLKCYLFTDINEGIVPINYNLFFGQKDDRQAFLNAVGVFQVGGDIRKLNRLSNSSIISENAVCIFITDKLGCELSDNVKMKYKKIAKQSVMILIDGEDIEIEKGLPITI